MHTEQGAPRAKGAPLDAFMLSPPFTLPLPTLPSLCLLPSKTEQTGIFSSPNNNTTFYQSKYYNKSLFLPPSSLPAAAPPASPIPRSVYPARITGLSSSWRYKLTSDTTNQLKASPLCARTCRNTKTRSCYEPIYNCGRNASSAKKRAVLEHKPTARFLIEPGTLLKSPPVLPSDLHFVLV